MENNNVKNPSVLVVCKNKKTHWTEYVNATDIILADGMSVATLCQDHQDLLKRVSELEAYKSKVNEMVKALALEIKNLSGVVATDTTRVNRILNALALNDIYNDEENA